MAPPAAKQTSKRSQKEQAHDESVMSTNSSSIVSKRSVERIYYLNEPHFFRFFVKKFQRRSPLINRGYHLRLHVIDVAVRNFLQRSSEKKKVVINLGCGSDVLPWQCMTRYPDHCNSVKFIDVDFPDLMENKSKTVRSTPELNSMLTGVEESGHPHLILQSDRYVQIGCDLRDLTEIHDALSSVVTIADCEFMFVAEVSITYMETKAADAVIRWASSLGQAEFCLLEQIIPDGADHPFAETMLKHFEKLKTPLKSVFAYPDLEAQKDRFARLGWSYVEAESLWSTWSSPKYLSSDDRKVINNVEPFDEWEEFAVFGSHYCVITSRTGTIVSDHCRRHGVDQDPRHLGPIRSLVALTEFSDDGTRGQRRFGAPMMLESHIGDKLLVNMFGFGHTTRLKSLDLFSSHPPARDLKLPSAGPPGRMCHTIVELGTYGNILMGGRASPSNPLKDCWLFNKNSQTWQQLRDLPTPLYRHAATRLGSSHLALVIGGKTGPSSVFNGSFLYHPETGWVECRISNRCYTPVFGAVLVSFNPMYSDDTDCSRSVHFRGILAGGLLEDGTVAKQILRWDLELPESGQPIINFTSYAGTQSATAAGGQKELKLDSIICRFGASAFVDEHGSLLIVGGIIEDYTIPREQEILVVDITLPKYQVIATASLIQADEGKLIPRPLLLGISVAPTADGRLVIMGGGATCFSMGTYWNKGCYTLSRSPISAMQIVLANTVRKPLGTTWKYHQTLEVTDAANAQMPSRPEMGAQQAVTVQIPRLRLDSPEAFSDILTASRPVIIEGSNLGSCLQAWTPEHLVAQVGEAHRVIVHEANAAKMDFNTKNFKYVTKDFGTFIQEVQRGGRMYLRALSEVAPTEKPANLSQDFPKLAEEFQLPTEMSFASQNTFSSVLRISGPVNMWLHYDVQANVYCQIVGSKRLILFPPADVTQLSFAPGASSSSLDVFAELDSSSLAGTHPHEAILKPGDVLFLPPLWLHTAKPLTGFGVAVNVFFRNLENGYSSGRDIYGNRDLAVYEKGREYIARLLNAFSKVPQDMREFYVHRLADELSQRLRD